MGPSYSNSFGSNVPQQPIMSAGTGDIILAPDDGGGKSRKGLVIVLIVLAVVLAGVGIWYAVWRGQGGGGSEDDESKLTLEEKFNMYANYLVSGEASKVPLEGRYGKTISYALTRAINNSDTDYLKQAKSYWMDFFRAYNDQDAVSIYNMDSQNEIMDFVVTYYDGLFLTDEALLKMCVENGVQETRDAIAVRYDELKNLNYSFVDEFLMALSKSNGAKIDLYDAYIGAGCVDMDYRLDSECIDSIPAIDELWERKDVAMGDDSMGVIGEAVDAVLRNTYRIAMELRDVE